MGGDQDGWSKDSEGRTMKDEFRGQRKDTIVKVLVSSAPSAPTMVAAGVSEINAFPVLASVGGCK